MPDTQTLQQMAGAVRADRHQRGLSRSCRTPIAACSRKLVEASKIVDGLFLRQVWAGNEAMLADLARDRSPEGRARLHYFLINKGPWSRLDHNAVFVPGAPAKPAGANYYPEGASKADVEDWIQSLPEARARSRDRVLHRDSPHPATPSRWFRTTSSIRASWCVPPGSCARPHS